MLHPKFDFTPIRAHSTEQMEVRYRNDVLCRKQANLIHPFDKTASYSNRSSFIPSLLLCQPANFHNIYHFLSVRFLEFLHQNVWHSKSAYWALNNRNIEEVTLHAESFLRFSSIKNYKRNFNLFLFKFDENWYDHFLNKKI